jgi:tetratricopeptide (TPR) repeat protein
MKKYSFILLCIALLSGSAAFAAATAFDQAFDVANKAYTNRKWQEAADLLVKAQELAKSDWQKYKVNTRLTNCYSYTKQNEKTIEAAAETLKYPKLTPRERNRVNNLIIEAMTRLKRYDEALKIVDTILAEPAREDEAYYNTFLFQGIALQEQKKYAAALAAFKKAETSKNTDKIYRSKVLWYIGYTALKTGDKAMAKTYFEKVAKDGYGWFAGSAKKHLQTLQSK